jgi:23S rRNA (cytosine1962-C5)-methyltransferase
MATPRLDLPASLEAPLVAGHPWIYRDRVPHGVRAPSGTWFEVVAGRFRGHALWDSDSNIALRVFSRRGRPDGAWFAERVRDAFALRAPLREAGISGFRLINGEGDGLPGLVVDWYAGYAVLSTYPRSVEALVPDVVRGLVEHAAPAGVVRRSTGAPERPGSRDLALLAGRLPPADLAIEEHGVLLRVDPRAGQKTGLFLDQRENRRFIAGLARGARVLNLFSYTGGFSLHALAGGAAHITQVDSAAAALQAARDNYALNHRDPDPHQFVVEDAFAYLQHQTKSRRHFDVVIVDPPSLARSKAQRGAALSRYRRLFADALRVTAPGGILAGASCTSQISLLDFHTVLAEAASRAHRRLQIIHDAGQPLDHPVLAGHPEGRYLKFVVARALAIP